MTHPSAPWPGYTPPTTSRGETEEIRGGLDGSQLLATRVLDEDTTEPDPDPVTHAPLFHEHGRIVGAEFGTEDDPDAGTIVRVRLDREDARIAPAVVHVTTEYPTVLARLDHVLVLRDWWARRAEHLEQAGHFDEARGAARCLVELNEALGRA